MEEILQGEDFCDRLAYGKGYLGTVACVLSFDVLTWFE